MKDKPCVILAAAALSLAALQAPAHAHAQAPATPADTPLGSGPHKAVMEVDPGLKTHTVYRPQDLAKVKEQLPIVVWGNGACVNTGNRFRWFLSEVASYGYLVIAVGPIGPSSVETTAAPAPGAAPAPAPTSIPPPATHTRQLIAAIDWALAENERPASRYYHRLDRSKIAVMGQSCGGIQAIEASADPRVTTTMVWNSGLLDTPTEMAGGKPMTKEDLKRLHGATAYISGDQSDIAFANANDDFARLDHVPVFRGYERGVPHMGTYHEPNGGEFGGVAVAWLNWRLKGDAKAARMFLGEACGLCVNPRWVARSKNLR